MQNRFVYLAGPILHCNAEQANDWRRSAANILIDNNITGISPLRCEPLHGETYELQSADPMYGTPRAIQAKNLFDVQQCDITLAYMPHLEGIAPSKGTICEISWAYAFNKPIILVSDSPEVIEHPVIQAQVPWILPTLEDGLEMCIGLLAGYVGGKNV